jgi:hypothetical protein
MQCYAIDLLTRTPGILRMLGIGNSICCRTRLSNISWLLIEIVPGFVTLFHVTRTKTKAQKLLDLVEHKQVIKTSDLDKAGIPRSYEKLSKDYTPQTKSPLQSTGACWR